MKLTWLNKIRKQNSKLIGEGWPSYHECALAITLCCAPPELIPPLVYRQWDTVIGNAILLLMTFMLLEGSFYLIASQGGTGIHTSMMRRPWQISLLIVIATAFTVIRFL